MVGPVFSSVHAKSPPQPVTPNRPGMARAHLTDRQAFAVAFAPTMLALVLLVATGALAVAPAAAVAAPAMLGAFWYLQRMEPKAATTGIETLQPRTTIPHDILERLPDPVILLNKGRVIVGVNRAARELLGIAGPGRDLALSLRHPAVFAGVEAVFSGTPEFTEDIALPVPIAREFTMNVSQLANAGDDAEPAAILVLHDQTR